MSRASVLFVCLGNICRSPTGEGVLQHLVEEEGLEDQILVDSAGTIGYHEGNPADPRMSSAALKRGIELRSRSRKITPNDLETFDLVLAMDQSNLDDIRALHDSPSSKIALLSDYLDDEWPTDVPDPYYGGESGFEFVMDMIEAACPNVLKELL
jgi:protein-tyrosine phosphatase